MIQNINSPRVEIQDHGRLTKNSTRVHGLTPKQNNKTSISTPKITTFNRSQNHEGVQTRILTLNKCGILAKPNHNHPNSMSPKDTTPEGDKLPDGGEIVEDTDADMEAEEERLLNGSQTSNANHEQRGSVRCLSR